MSKYCVQRLALCLSAKSQIGAPRVCLLKFYSSGELNAKNRELLELQTLAQRRLQNSRANFADGMKAAKEVKKDLEWTQKRVK